MHSIPDGSSPTIASPNSGSMYFNYKKTFSMVMLAVIDAFCKFVLLEIGSMGSEGDNSIFRSSAFGQAFMNDSIDFPEPRFLPGMEVLAPMVWVGDDAFPNKTNLLRPYPKNPTFCPTPGTPPQPVPADELKKTKVFNY